MSKKMVIESLSMDLLRAALGLHRGSVAMGRRFEQEALKRGDEITALGIKDKYLNQLVYKTRQTIINNFPEKAEDLLMYGILFKNIAQFRYPNQ